MADNNRTQTGLQIVRRTLQAIGLPVPVSVSGATDTLSVQIWSLLTELGQELLSEYGWTFKTKVFTLTTAYPTLIYDLPADFVRLIDETGWNNTSRLPISGPLSPQEWAMITARSLGSSTISLQWRLRNDKIEFYSVPTDAQTVEFHYISRGWVQVAVDPTEFRDTMENDSDICLYPPRLMVAMLRWRWRSAKGFNTIDLEREYKIALNHAKNDDTPGQRIYLSGGPRLPFLSTENLSDTGYGS